MKHSENLRAIANRVDALKRDIWSHYNSECRRGARMQLLKEFMQSRRCNSNTDYWEQYCNINPDAKTWFDDDGVPL